MSWMDDVILIGDAPTKARSWMDDAIPLDAPDEVAQEPRPVYTEEQKRADYAAFNREQLAAQAEKTLGESNLSILKASMIKLGSGAVSPIYRALGQGEKANQMIRFSKAIEEAQQRREAGGLIPDWMQRGVRNIGESLFTAVATAPAGPVGIIGAFSAQQVDQAYVEGKDAGLEGAELTAYVTKMASYEALPALIAQRLGVGGLEKVLGKGGSKAFSRNLKSAFKQTGKDITHEVVEEVTTSLLQAREGVESGVSPDSLSPENIQRLILDSAVGAIGGTAIASIPSLLASQKHGKINNAKTALTKSAESGVPLSRGEWQKLGLPADEGRSRAARMAAATGAAAEIKAAELPATPEAAAPATPAQEQVPGAPQEAIEGIPTVQPEVTPPTAPVAQESELQPPWTNKAAEAGSQSFEAMVDASPVSPQAAAQSKAPVVSEAPEVTAQKSLTKQVPVKEQPIGEAKALFEDESGSISVPVATFAKAWGGLKTLKKRYFATGGLLPEAIQTAKLKKEGQQAKLARQISEVVSDYKAAAKETYGTKNPSAANTEAIVDVLNGRSDVSVLPESMQDAVMAMRSAIDSGSRELIRSGAVQGDLAAIVAKNAGVYMTRTFKAFTDPKWHKNVPKDKMNAAVAMIRSENPEMSEAEVQGLIASILYEGKAAETPLALIRRASELGAKDLGILKKKNTEIKEEILDLLGEHKDPLVLFTQSAAKIGTMIANHKFLTEVRAAGMEAGYFNEKPTINKFGELKTKIADEGNTSMAPLAGLYTTPEIKDAFQRATDPKQIGPVLRAYYKYNLMVKAAKTIHSPQAIVRNFIANPLIAVKNGHIDITGDYLGQGKDFWKAIQATGKDVAPDWAKNLAHMVMPQFVNNLLAMDTKEYRALMSRAAEVGLIGHDVVVGDLRATLKDSGLFGADADIAGVATKRRGKMGAAWKASQKLAVDVYQAGDSVWKLYGWMREKKQQRRAHPDMPQAELEQMSADIVTDTYPTYSKTSEFVGLMRKNILTGSFVSFPAEIVRTTFNTMKLTREEMTSDNPEMRRIGNRRLTGMLTAVTVSIGVPAMSRLMAGVSADDEEDMREFMPEWQKNSHLVHLGKNKDGHNTHIDMSYSDPHSILVKPMIAFMRGAKDEGIKKAFEESFFEFFDPFISEEILFKALSEAWRNSKGAHKLDVYNEEDTTFQKGLSVGKHVGRAFLYGGIASGERIGRGLAGVTERTGMVRDPKVEALSVLTGQRVSVVNIPQSLFYIAGAFSSRLDSSDDIFRDVIKNRGHVSESAIISAYKRSDNARRGVFERMFKVVQAAQRLGVPAHEVRAIIKDRGISALMAQDLMTGRYRPYAPTPARLQTLRGYNKEEYGDRYDAWKKAVKESETVQ